MREAKAAEEVDADGSLDCEHAEGIRVLVQAAIRERDGDLLLLGSCPDQHHRQKHR